MLGTVGERCDLLADGEVLGRSAELVAEIEALSEVVEALGELPALDGVEGEVTATSVILNNVKRKFMRSERIVETNLVGHAVGIEVAAGEGQVLV